MCKVSVNVLSTNEIQHVGRSIEAILNQTYGDIELLVIDNGSTDGTAEFIRGRYNDKVKLIQSNSNLGCAGGNNLGIRESQGAYIMPCDANLFMTPTYIEEMVKVGKELHRVIKPGHPCIFVLGDLHSGKTVINTAHEIQEAYKDIGFKSHGIVDDWMPTKKCVPSTIKRKKLDRILILERL